jgi:hypothetical protein
MPELSMIVRSPLEVLLAREGGWPAVPGWLEMREACGKLWVRGPNNSDIGVLPLDCLASLTGVTSVGIVEVTQSGLKQLGESLVLVA